MPAPSATNAKENAAATKAHDENAPTIRRIPCRQRSLSPAAHASVTVACVNVFEPRADHEQRCAAHALGGWIGLGSLGCSYWVGGDERKEEWGGGFLDDGSTERRGGWGGTRRVEGFEGVGRYGGQLREGGVFMWVEGGGRREMRGREV